VLPLGARHGLDVEVCRAMGRVDVVAAVGCAMMPHVEGGVCNLNPTRVRGRTLWFRRAQNSRRQAFHHRRRVPSAAADAGSLASCLTTNAHGAGLSFSDATAVTDGRTRLCAASTPSLSEAQA